jgi:hypothetical protein
MGLDVMPGLGPGDLIAGGLISVFASPLAVLVIN